MHNLPSLPLTVRPSPLRLQLQLCNLTVGLIGDHAAAHVIFHQAPCDGSLQRDSNHQRPRPRRPNACTLLHSISPCGGCWASDWTGSGFTIRFAHNCANLFVPFSPRSHLRQSLLARHSDTEGEMHMIFRNNCQLAQFNLDAVVT